MDETYMTSSNLQNRDRVLLDILGAAQVTLPECVVEWWQNRRSNGGMRLSQRAQQWLETSTAPRWSFDIDPAWITPRNMLRMDRLIPVPYSLDISNRPRRCWITVWDSGQAMTIELVGDFDRFLAALERTWPRNTVGKC